MVLQRNLLFYVWHTSMHTHKHTLFTVHVISPITIKWDETNTTFKSHMFKYIVLD
jgi:hypothetical protein